MDTFVARLLPPAPVFLVTLVAATVLLVIAVALALAAGVDSIGVAMTDNTPFRWA